MVCNYFICYGPSYIDFSLYGETQESIDKEFAKGHYGGIVAVLKFKIDL